MILAFTGTRAGMTPKQRLAVFNLVENLKPSTVLHGDCIGADTDFHKICMAIRGSIINPEPPFINLYPADHSARAHNEGYDTIYPAADDPLKRNLAMVKACDELIATPKEYVEIIRSGTWTTRRYAIKEKKVIYTVYPDGTVG